MNSVPSDDGSASAGAEAPSPNLINSGPLQTPVRGNVFCETTPDDPQGMTILLALDTGQGVPAMVKTWFQGATGIECRQYDKAWLFMARTVSVATFSLLCAVLAAIKSLTRACVIRGKLLPHADPNKTMRRCVETEGKQPSFAEYPRSWLLLDFDKFDSADFPDPKVNPQGCIEEVRRRLPAQLRHVAFFWSFSSSTGIKAGKLGVHLYLLLEKPLGWREVKAFTTTCGADSAMSRTVQVHYTGVPVFVLPLSDPLPERFGVMPGVERVPADVIADLIEQGHLSMAQERAKREEDSRRKRAEERAARKAAAVPASEQGNHSKSVVSAKPKITTPAPHQITTSEETPPGKIGDGSRNQHLMTLAGFARDRGLDAEAIRLVLTTENDQHCDPPLAGDRVEAMADSFARYPTNQDVSDAWKHALRVTAGLIRHGACAAAATCAAEHLLGDAVMALRVVDALYDLDDTLLSCAEHRPDLVIDRAALS